MEREKRARRRVPRRWILAAVVVLPLAASERWGGPLSIEHVRGGVSSVAEAASDRFGLVDDRSDSSSDRPDDVDRDGDGELTIHLTFDDGPHPVFTPKVLDVLADHDATAVFFPVGSRVADGASILRRAVTEGHRIGNHTWQHDRLSSASVERFEQAVGRTQVAVAKATGVLPRCLRPPGGNVDGRTERLAEDAGLRVTMWTIDPQDWDEPGASTIVDRVLTSAGDGDIVLLHDGGGEQDQTVDALGRILDELSDRGFRFTPVPGC